MALTMVQIINLVLLELGHEAVSSLDGGDALVNAAVSAYEMKLPSVLSTGNWRFAVQIAELSKSVETPPQPYGGTSGAIYLLPAGWLKVLRLYPNIYQWDIYAENKIYTVYVDQLFCEYVFQPNVSQLPAHFTDYFVYEVAAFLALSNAQQAQYYSALEQKRIQMMGIANAVEAQNRPQFTQTLFPMLANRYVGGIIGNSISGI